MFSQSSIESSLEALGRALAARGLSYELVAVGGGSLLLLGLISRPTADLDVVALIESGMYVTAPELPALLLDTARDVGGVMGLRPDWINPGPAGLLDLGLPPGFAARTKARRFGALMLHAAGRTDQVFLKLYAAADQGPRSKHFQDLLALSPTSDELIQGARWAITHDPSRGFRQELLAALAALGVADAGIEL